MVRVVAVLIVVALTVAALVHLTRTPRHDVEWMPRWVWALVILAVPVLGPLGWLTLHCVAPLINGPAHPGGHSVAPDDDVAFLASLDAHRRRPSAGDDDAPR